MAKSFNELRKKMSPEQCKKADEKAAKMLQDMQLNELRKALSFTQEQLAMMLDTKQAGLSRLEGQTDMYISTLMRYIEAMGGELDIIARFPSGDVRISQFQQTKPTAQPSTSARRRK